jgi:hypothetical protein
MITIYKVIILKNTLKRAIELPGLARGELNVRGGGEDGGEKGVG